MRIPRLSILPLALMSVAAALACSPQRSDGAVRNRESATREIRFRSGDVTLAGTLIVPSNMVAAVVLVHGSGKRLRDVPLAEALARIGVGALAYDKRGVGQSQGIYAGPEVGTNNTDPGNLDLLAGDASAAVKALLHEISSPLAPVGLLGSSQAGWIIPLAAARTPEAKFMILWSGPVVTVREQSRFQYLTDGRADFWDRHTETEVREHIRSDPDRYAMVDTDPVETLRRLSIPGLWLFGDRDEYVPVRLSIERLNALAASGKPFEHRLFPNVGHDLRSNHFDQALAASMDWLTKTVARTSRGLQARTSRSARRNAATSGSVPIVIRHQLS